VTNVPLPFADFSDAKLGEPYSSFENLWACDVRCYNVLLTVIGANQVECLARAVALERLLAGGLWLAHLHELGAGVIGVDTGSDGNAVVSYPPVERPPYDPPG